MSRSGTGGTFTQLDASGPQRRAILHRCRGTIRVYLGLCAARRLGRNLPQRKRSPSLVRRFGRSSIILFPTLYVCGWGTTNVSFLRITSCRADFVYMVPPFIAYFGALQNDTGGLALLQIAYDQISLYRDALFDADVSLWRHITLGSWEDSGHWATGAQIFWFTTISQGEKVRCWSS